MPVIFLHIPKTAGTNIHNILHREYRSEERFSFVSTRDEEKFVSLSESEKEKIEILIGHQNFGLHEHFKRPSTYFSFMRNPVERIISAYYYYLNNPSFPAAIKMKENKINSLKEFVECGLFPMEDNMQTRFIGGGRDIAFGKCTDELFEKAISNIEKYFSVVGTEEKYDESLLLLKNNYGWKKWPFYSRLNVNKKKPNISEFDLSTMNAIRNANLVDEKLYQYVKKRLKDRKSVV